MLEKLVYFAVKNGLFQILQLNALKFSLFSASVRLLTGKTVVRRVVFGFNCDVRL